MPSVLRRKASRGKRRPTSLFAYPFDRTAYVRWRLRCQWAALVRVPSLPARTSN